MIKRLIAIPLLLLAFSASAVDVVGERYLKQMLQGGDISLKSAAKSIYNTKYRDPEVIDVAAEILLSRYASAANHELDTLAWVAKAIGSTNNGRYYSAIEQVVNDDATHGKIGKHAKRALKSLGGTSGVQYKAGMVNLDKKRKAVASGKAAPKAASKSRSSSGNAGLDVVRVGMSMQEVYALVGHPTNTANHQTGKAWIPFNFGAQDLARTIAMYKGQGRVVFSHDGYSQTPTVIEVNLDPNESGYP